MLPESKDATAKIHDVVTSFTYVNLSVINKMMSLQLNTVLL